MSVVNNYPSEIGKLYEFRCYCRCGQLIAWITMMASIIDTLNIILWENKKYVSNKHDYNVIYMGASVIIIMNLHDYVRSINRKISTEWWVDKHLYGVHKSLLIYIIIEPIVTIPGSILLYYYTDIRAIFTITMVHIVIMYDMLTFIDSFMFPSILRKRIVWHVDQLKPYYEYNMAEENEIEENEIEENTIEENEVEENEVEKLGR